MCGSRGAVVLVIGILAVGGCATRKGGSRAAARQETLEGIGCVALGTCYGQPETVGVQVTGRVVVGDAGLEQPLPFTRLQLMQGGRPMATTSTDAKGNFHFRRLDHGAYVLVLDSDRHEGRAAFELGWKTVELVLTAKPRGPR